MVSWCCTIICLWFLLCFFTVVKELKIPALVQSWLTTPLLDLLMTSTRRFLFRSLQGAWKVDSCISRIKSKLTAQLCNSAKCMPRPTGIDTHTIINVINSLHGKRNHCLSFVTAPWVSLHPNGALNNAHNTVQPIKNHRTFNPGSNLLTLWAV